VPGEDELEARLAEPLDEVDDLAAGVAHDVSDAGIAQAVADDASDGSDAERIGRVSR
jgi:hypothetical protein